MGVIYHIFCEGDSQNIYINNEKSNQMNLANEDYNEKENMNDNYGDDYEELREKDEIYDNRTDIRNQSDKRRRDDIKILEIDDEKLIL